MSMAAINIGIFCAGAALLIVLAFFLVKLSSKKFSVKALITLIILAAAILLLIIARKSLIEVTACAENIGSLGAATELYGVSGNGKYPASTDELIPFYFDNLPRCPISSEPYLYERGEDNFTLSCRGHHRGLCGTPDGFPKYSSDCGELLK
ncbi:MAG: hypothetical protein K6G50_13410 [bacterium]|nr:hypothetical protein [bacterium]